MGTECQNSCHVVQISRGWQGIPNMVIYHYRHQGGSYKVSFDK